MISPGSANRSENGRHMNNENKNGKREYAPSCVTWHIACCGAPHCGGLLESVAGSPGPESGVVCHDRHPARYRDERRVEKWGGGGVDLRVLRSWGVSRGTRKTHVVAACRQAWAHPGHGDGARVVLLKLQIGKLDVTSVTLE